MQDFKKAIMSTVVTIILVFVLTLCFLYFRIPATYPTDNKLRNRMAGTIDFLIVGASHGQCGLYTQAIDEVLGTNSYNLASDALRYYEKKYLLEKEINRNPVKTVIFDFAYDTWNGEYNVTHYTDSSIYSLLRCDSFSDRIHYLREMDIPDNRKYAFFEWLVFSIFPKIDETNEMLKGSNFLSNKDWTLPADEIEEKYNSETYCEQDSYKVQADGFRDMIELCKNNDINVILAVIPVSDHYIWTYSNLDDFDVMAEKFAKDMGVTFIDFNLLRNRYDILSDKTSYGTDTHHLCDTGSIAFSESFAKILLDLEKGKDISAYFYSSYDELKLDSPYRR